MADIEYFYSAQSAFAYLGSARFAQIAAGHHVIHKPVDLDKVVPATGSPGFRERSPAHRSYFFRREIQRWSEYRAAPIMKGHPTSHYADITLANCMLVAGIDAGLDVQPLAHAMLQSHWRDDADLSLAATLQGLAEATGFDAAALLQTAAEPRIRAIYAANTQEAITRSVFGSPTYFVNGDMFYGQDRLELVQRALVTPFAGR